jgi:hypothetical protein
MTIGPREIVTPFRPIPLEVPEGMKPNEFFNSTENLNDLVNNNGLLVSPEHLLLYRKALGHSCEFDCSIIYNTSQTILNPLGRPVRRTQVPAAVKHAWNRMNQNPARLHARDLSRPGGRPWCWRGRRVWTPPGP